MALAAAQDLMSACVYIGHFFKEAYFRFYFLLPGRQTCYVIPGYLLITYAVTCVTCVTLSDPSKLILGSGTQQFNFLVFKYSIGCLRSLLVAFHPLIWSYSPSSRGFIPTAYLYQEFC